MKRVLSALVGLLALPSAALACSCLKTEDPAQLRELAKDAARGAVALVEVEAVRGYDASAGTGEDVQITRTLAGAAAKDFRVARRQFASSASCDDLLQTGQRKIMILYPATDASSDRPTYRVSSSCTNLLMSQQVFRDALTSEIGRRVGERG